MDIFVFYQLRPEGHRKLKWIHKLDTILPTVKTTRSKTIIIAEYTNIDYKKSSTFLEIYKEVIDTCNLKQHVTK